MSPFDAWNRRNFLATLGATLAQHLTGVATTAAKPALERRSDESRANKSVSLPLPGPAEFRSATSGAVYPAEWPSGPPRSSVPNWARPGRIRFTRWDGGPIETAKAFLSGWPNFNPPVPEYLYVMTNWYIPKTVELLRKASFNTIWVTFSNGFSIPTEAVQRELLQKYIDLCHLNGIHVYAYQSLGNMFWEDMFKNVPQSRDWINLLDGKPQPYGAATYAKMGRVTRYMADLSKPGWVNYLKQRIDLAISAGADGIMYDNCFHPEMGKVVAELQRYANSRNPQMLIMANFHNSDFIFNRLINSFTTEEGGEAGIFSKAHVLNGRWKPYYPYMLRVRGGLLANNIGRFKVFENLSEGWKPVMLESRLREKGIPETTVMTAERQQLVLAENMMFSMSNETFVEDTFAARLWNRDPETMHIWHAIGIYNRFFADNERYYVDTKSVASLAIVLDDRSAGIPLLSGLAGRRVMYDVLYEDQLTLARLKPYAAVALLTAVRVCERAIKALQEFVANGGKLFTVGNAAAVDERGKPRSRPAFFSEKSGRGEATYYKNLPLLDELARVLISACRPPVVRVTAPDTVLYNVVEQPADHRLIVHVLNYSPEPAGEMKVTIAGRYSDVRILTPDAGRPASALHPVYSSHSTEITIPLKIYSLVAASQ